MSSLCNFTTARRFQASSSFSLFVFSRASYPFPMRFAAPFPSRVAASIPSSIKLASSSGYVTSTFSWDDVFSIPESGAATEDSSSYLQGYFQKVQLCNRGSEKQSEFLPFVIEDQIVGFIHNGFADKLRSFRDVFIFPKDKSYGSHFDDYVSLNPMLKTPEQRTSAVGNVVKCLGEEWIPALPCDIIFWCTRFLFVRTCCSSLFWNKG